MKTFTSESIAEIHEALKHHRTILFIKGGKPTDKIYLDADSYVIWSRKGIPTKNMYELRQLNALLKENIKECDSYMFSKDGNDRRKK